MLCQYVHQWKLVVTCEENFVFLFRLNRVYVCVRELDIYSCYISSLFVEYIICFAEYSAWRSGLLQEEIHIIWGGPYLSSWSWKTALVGSLSRHNMGYRCGFTNISIVFSFTFFLFSFEQLYIIGSSSSQMSLCSLDIINKALAQTEALELLELIAGSVCAINIVWPFPFFYLCCIYINLFLISPCPIPGKDLNLSPLK